MSTDNCPFKKKELTLRQLLVGRRYFNALKAMEFAKGYHKGKRRDKITPEFDHQISIALFALTLPDILHPEELICVIFLHDVREDYHVSDSEIRALFVDAEFAGRVAHAVECMTKEFRGVRKDDHLLFQLMALDPIASVAKLCDRIHNLQSMVGVFKLAKQKEYIREVLELFLPMQKAARRNFPHQTAAYENCKWMLKSQIQLIEAIHQAMEAPKGTEHGV